MNIAHPLKVLALVSTAVLMVGCKGISSSCSKPQAYATAENVPSLKVPVGLDGPDTRGALVIPDLNEPEAPRGPDSACLEEPPAFKSTGTSETASGESAEDEEPASTRRPGARSPRAPR